MEEEEEEEEEEEVCMFCVVMRWIRERERDTDSEYLGEEGGC